MLRQSRQRPARRRALQQIDLFAENAPTIGGMPAWFALPMETQAALTTLMTRLILEYPDKPKRMRWTTYNLLMDKLVAADDVADERLALLAEGIVDPCSAVRTINPHRTATTPSRQP